MNSLVSIIIPTYNRANCILDAISSIKEQTAKNYEIIVVDDGSSDNTEEILNPYIINKEIRYFKHSKNKGQAEARNKGIENVKGEYIAYLDSDNYLYRNWLEEINHYFHNNKNITWIYPRLNIKLIVEGVHINVKAPEFSKEESLNIKTLWRHDFEADPTGLTHKTSLLDGVRWDKNLEVYEDYDYALQLSKKDSSGFAIHPYVLGMYIRDYNSNSISAANTHKRLAYNLEKIYEKHKDFLPFYNNTTAPDKIKRYQSYNKNGITVAQRIKEKLKLQP